MKTKSPKTKCPECKATSRNLWKLHQRETDFGGQYGKIRWTKYQCRKCSNVWVEREEIKEAETAAK